MEILRVLNRIGLSKRGLNWQRHRRNSVYVCFVFDALCLSKKAFELWSSLEDSVVNTALKHMYKHK